MTEFSNSLAVVIGIDQYGSGINSLQTAVSDVEAIAQSLQQDHGYDVLSFVDQQATLSVLQYLIATLLPRRVKPESQLLFYFAGHGIALNGEEGPEGYLIPQDATAGDTGSYLAMPKLQAALSALPCRHFLGILDCCFAGAFRWSSTRDIGYESGPIYQERYNRFVQDPAWQILTSAAHDQTALDAFSLTGHRGQVGAHSPFAAALIEALGGKADAYPPAKDHRPAGDGVITATELYLYLRDRVEIATTARALRQTPGLHSLKKHDKGEYIFLVPGHPLNLPAAPNLNESANPYRGLQAFEAEHSALFFGRTRLVEQLKDFVEVHPLTVVLGASGCGKSSLVKAGLLPLLQQPSTQSWQVLPTIRPGEHPLEALNQALAQAGLPAVERFDDDAEDSGNTLVQSVAAWVARSPNCPLLIFIDQSEEVITLCASDRERYRFFQQILTAVDTYRGQLRVVISLRSDFEPQVRDSGLKFAPEALRKKGQAELKSRWQKGRFLVPAMTRAELREAIEKPAEARVMYFEPYTLVDQLIDEVANMPGALPLLSFALSELYLKYLKRQQTAAYSGSIENRALTQSDYEDLGGVVYALTQRATCEYETLVTQEACYEQTVKNVMLRMVATGGEMARRKVPEAELLYPEPEDSRVKTVIEKFLAARLITTGTDANDEVYLEPAHDALVRGWDKLLIWKSEAEEKLLLQRRVTQAAKEWEDARKDEWKQKTKESHPQPQMRWKLQRKPPQKANTFLWNASPYLNVLTEMLQARNHGFNRVETAFIQQSLRLKQQQSRRRKGIMLTVTSAIAAAAIFSTVQAVIAQLNISTALRRSSSANFASNRYQFDALIDGLVAANRLSAFPGNRFMHTTQAETQTALTVPLFWTRELNRITHHSDAVQSVDYSPNGKLFVTGGYDGAVIVSHADGRLFKRFGESDNEVMSVHFSPDGQTVAAARIGGDVDLWTIKDGSRRVIETNEAVIYTVRFSPDGQYLLTGGPDNSAKLWTRRGDFVQTVGNYREPIRSAQFIADGSQNDSQNDSHKKARVVIGSADGTVAFWQLDGADSHLLSTQNNDSGLTMVDVSPDGQLIAISSLDNTVTLWDSAGNLLETLQHSQEIWSVAFSADGRSLATGGAEGEITLWTSKGQRLDSWAAHVGPINSLDFSPDGTMLITAGNDYITKVWQLQREWMQALEGHAGSVESVQFSADSNTVVSGSENGELWLWDATGGSPALKQTVSSTIYDVNLSSDEEKIALANGDGEIQILNEAGDSLETIEAHSEAVRSVSFSPDGNNLASASSDGTVKLWSLARTKPINSVSFDEHDGRVLSVNFSPDGQRLVTAGDDAIVRVFSVEGSLLEAFEEHEILVREAVFSPDGQLIASASSDRTIKLWNLETGKVTTLAGAAGHKTAVTAVSFSPDGEMLASASTDHSVKLWHRDGRLITTLLGHTSYVNAVAFSPDGKQLISADYQGKILVWQVADISLAQAIEKGCAQVKDYISSGPPKDLRGLKKICKPAVEATTAR
ncbi:MAG: caspase family protein [Cyanobacteria bacterium P01_A01_bin.116]